MISAGIEAMNVFGGTAYIDVQALAAHRKLDLHRFENLMMKEKTVALPYEDPVTFAVNAAKPIIDKLSQKEKDQIELLITCTESGIDAGKSLSTYIHDYLGLNHNCRLFELKNACYAGFAFLAFPFFMVSAFIAGGIGIFYILNQVQIKMAIDKLREEETAFLDAMTHLIDGFKELRLNDFKSNSFFHTCIKPLYSRLKSLRLESARYLLINQEIVYGTWALLLGMLPLVFPFVNVSDSSLHICISILFFFPIGILLDAIPSVLQTLVSVQRLWEMKQELEVTELDYANIISKEDRAPFSELRYQDIIFHYQTDENHSFSVGPINLSIHAGEILFITGGNGSGKSTLLKMITGLYASETGNIILNGKAVEIRQHRYLFSIIFSDFYLFDRLYGLPDVDENWVNELIKLMKLDKKVTFADGRFNTTDLSSGKKKRLALVAAILEDRPVYVFDEWAAEQDPHFRRYFYETLVPSFKSQGKTVIAITHHDQYFHLADRIIKMDYGRVCLH